MSINFSCLEMQKNYTFNWVETPTWRAQVWIEPKHDLQNAEMAKTEKGCAKVQAKQTKIL